MPTVPIDHVEATQHVQQRALAHTGRPDHRHHLASLDLKVDLTQHIERAAGGQVGLVKTGDLDQGHY